MTDWKKVTFSGQWIGVKRMPDGLTSILLPSPAQEPMYDVPDYIQYKKDIANGGQLLEADANLVFSEENPINGIRLTTNNATSTELTRFTLRLQTLYRARLELLAVDRGNGVAKYINAIIVFKRLNAGALMIGVDQTVLLQDAGASTWTIPAPAISGNDIVINVTGAAGRTIDWNLTGFVRSVTPSGW